MFAGQFVFANIVQNLVSTHVGRAGRPQGQLWVHVRLVAFFFSFSNIINGFTFSSLISNSVQGCSLDFSGNKSITWSLHRKASWAGRPEGQMWMSVRPTVLNELHFLGTRSKGIVVLA